METCTSNPSSKLSINSNIIVRKQVGSTRFFLGRYRWACCQQKRTGSYKRRGGVIFFMCWCVLMLQVQFHNNRDNDPNAWLLSKYRRVAIFSFKGAQIPWHSPNANLCYWLSSLRDSSTMNRFLLLRDVRCLKLSTNP